MDIDGLLKKWLGSEGGAERANYALFINDFCEALDLPKPGIASSGVLGDYQFEGPVPGGSRNGGTGFIDVYRRGHFILEAKQSKLAGIARANPNLFDADENAPTTPSGAKYDQLMREARRQAEQYAHSLPGDHPAVPFIIVCDVGRAFELYFDYAGNGRGYGFFPDKQSYRVALPDLASDRLIRGIDKTAADTLRTIWLDPKSIDPRARTADVTSDVARKLAQVSKHLEEEGRRELKRRGLADTMHEAELVEGTALFLMRILFCMFAEDVGLLPKHRFQAFLESCALPYDPENPGHLIDDKKLRNGLIALWEKMGLADLSDRYAWPVEDDVRYFNGGLFETKAVFPLARNDLDSLINAARHEWKNVEPAIFGTLLEQALSDTDRAKLGAHYTPRPYVERLVQATIMDVLQPEWAAVQDGIAAAKAAGDDIAALEQAQAFLDRLQRQRVLDPACGTGNFLYVSMESLLRLESDVIETVTALGGHAEPKIGPEQFLGLELSPRAAVIAELVLWIGWLRWRTANDPAAVPDPVLRRTNAINFGGHFGYDAALARDEAGLPDLECPHRPAWPAAEFIVGNPPFIGKGALMRKALGDDYVEGLRRANSAVPASADFVMQWWDRAADLLAASETHLRRFGLVTTNSITQDFNRRVLAAHMAGDPPISLVMACPDHPWTKASSDAAAVRIAMTVAERGVGDGCLVHVLRVKNERSNDPQLEIATETGRINPDLTIGARADNVDSLRANSGVCYNGMMLAGAGFKLSALQAAALRDKEPSVVRPYLSGADLLRRPHHEYVIDFAGISEREARRCFPDSYSHLLLTVKVERDRNRDKGFRDRWWQFGRTRPELRAALAAIDHYIATTETAKHRIFQFVSANVLPDHMVIAIASDDAALLGILSSRFHTEWSLAVGGTLEDRPRYNKARIFDPFPFPDASSEARDVIAEIAEEIDATRRGALAENDKLTMTGLYNLVEAVRAGTLPPDQEQAAVRARARIVAKLHDDLDAAVAAAYGWPADLPPAEIVTRLVALNAERAAEEAAGHVRWLRPDYQQRRFERGG